ncbi:MAG TPA: tyrosine-type recombinase/integrase, partial [Lacipirellulaceae bacterium]|nr:tyrosine-type recombinase/integrase [Lacipirellulaceae bacterium]
MRSPKPWYRKQNKTWYVEIGGKQVNLGRDKREAHEKFRRMNYRPGQQVHTVRDIIDAYWNWLRRNRAQSTCDRRHPILQSFGLSVPASLRGADLKAHHVQAWLDANDKKRKPQRGKGTKGKTQRSDEELSPTTVGDYITTIKVVMNWAESMDYIDRNPIAKMKKPAAHIRQNFLPVNDWPRLRAAALDEPFRRFLIVMLATGARPNEMRRFEARHLMGGKFVLPIEESKGRKRSRVVYLPDDALAIVKGLAKQFPRGPLFRNSKDEPWTNNAVVCRFRRLRERMKIPGLTATVLRHSYAHYRLTAG